MTKKGFCILVSDYREKQTQGFVTGIEQEANQLGYTTTTFSMLQLSERFSNNEEVVYKLVDYDKYLAVIIVTQSFSPHKEVLRVVEEELVKNCKVPILSIGQSDCFPFVTYSDEKNSELLTNHLIDKHKCSKIYLLGGEQDQRDSFFIGHINALKKHEMEVDENNFLYGGYWSQCAEKLAKEIAYGVVERPDAVMCISDIVAFALIKNLYRLGVRVPEDVIVTGFMGQLLDTNPIFTVTSIENDTIYVGRCALQKLLTELGGEEPPKPVKRRSPVCTGMSCGCGRGKNYDFRLMIEKADRREEQEMQFRNSYIEEKLYGAHGKEELTRAIKDLSYLIPNRRNLSVNLITEGENKAECIFMSGSISAENSVSFTATDIYPKGYPIRTVYNTQVLPLMFDKKFYGYLAIGYETAEIPCTLTCRFAEKVSNALMILDLNKQDRSVTKPIPEGKTEPEKKNSVEALFATKDGVTSKIAVDKIIYFEAVSRKVFAVTENASYEIGYPLYEVEKMLANSSFLRISKSTVLNMKKVVSFQPEADRTLLVHLPGNKKVRVSRAYGIDFKNAL